MKIPQLLKSLDRPSISFEIFPPKAQYPIESIYSTIEALQSCNPDFISVTYSAGGTGNNMRTAQLATMIKKTYGIDTVAHLTCLNENNDSIRNKLEEWKNNGIENVLALRGDYPADFDVNSKRDFKYASDIIPIVHQSGLCAGAAAYTEGHIECESSITNIEHLKIKADAGAEFFITQLFFDNNCFYNFFNDCAKAGINQPILAGIMPMLSRSQIERMVFTCGASLPSEIIKLLYKYQNSDDDIKKAGIEYAAKQINKLLEFGANGIHIYTMNKPDVARGLLEKIDSGFLK